MEAGLLELRFDDIANQRQYLRLGLEQLSLRTGVLHEFYRKPFYLVIGQIFLDQFFSGAVIHLIRSSCLAPQGLFQCPSKAPPAAAIFFALRIKTIHITLTMSASEHIGPKLPS